MFSLLEDLSILTIILLILAIIGIFFLSNTIAVWLWGIIAVEVFHLPVLTFWQMVGLRVLIWMLAPFKITNLKGD